MRHCLSHISLQLVLLDAVSKISCRRQLIPSEVDLNPIHRMQSTNKINIRVVSFNKDFGFSKRMVGRVFCTILVIQTLTSRFACARCHNLSETHTTPDSRSLQANLVSVRIVFTHIINVTYLSSLIMTQVTSMKYGYFHEYSNVTKGLLQLFWSSF